MAASDVAAQVVAVSQSDVAAVAVQQVVSGPDVAEYCDAGVVMSPAVVACLFAGAASLLVVAGSHAVVVAGQLADEELQPLVAAAASLLVDACSHSVAVAGQLADEEL